MNDIKIIKNLGRISLILTVWFLIENIYFYLRNTEINIIDKCINGLGVVLFLIAGLGMIRIKRWAEYLFILLMIYWLYSSLIKINIHLLRIKMGNNFIVSLPVELIGIFVNFFIILFPTVSIYYIIKHLTKK